MCRWLGSLILTTMFTAGCGRALAPLDPASPTPLGAWRWENTLPQGNALSDVWGSAVDDVWAIGAHGTLLHFDGHAWSVGRIGNDDLNAIWGAAANDVWAVGARGTILHFDGEAWTSQAPASQASLADLWGSSATDVWAVGDQGAVIHFDGQRWSAVESGTTTPLLAVSGTSARDVWIGGGAGCPDCAPRVALLHGGVGGDGTPAFTTIDPIPSWSISFAIWARAPGDVWTATTTGLYHFDGGAWSREMATGGTFFTGFSARSADDAWAAGDSTLAHFDGTAWTSWAVSMGTRAVWAGADTWSVGSAGLTLHFDGSAWKEPIAQLSRDYLTAVWASGSNDVYAAGYASLVHYDGRAWRRVAMPDEFGLLSVTSIVGSGPDDVWIGGESHGSSTPALLYHFDGASWRAVSFGDDLDGILGLWMSGRGDVWALGQSIWGRGPARLFHVTPGQDPIAVPLPATSVERPVAVWGAGPSDLFVVTTSQFESKDESTFIYRGNGKDWHQETIDRFAAVGLWGSSAGDVWAVGTNEVLPNADFAHRDGDGAWTISSLPADLAPTGALHAITGVNAKQVYAIQQNTILRYDGVRWSLDCDLSAAALSGIAATDGHAWAVGGGGTILRR